MDPLVRVRVQERLSGEAYSYSADVWAFGIIMLELASGSYPYPKPNSYFELLGAIMDKPPPTLPEGKAFSDGLGEFLGLCLDKTAPRRLSAKDLLKHPWLRSQPPALLSDRSASSESSRHDRSSPSPFERSRSSVKEFEISSAIAGMTLGDASQ